MNPKRLLPIFAAALLAPMPVLLAAAAHAVPGTYTVTPSELSPAADGGAPDGFRIYQGCDLDAQSVAEPAVADNVVVGGNYAFPGDSDTPPTICAVAYNSAGESPFANTVTLSTSQKPPGAVTISVTCQFVADTGEIRDCTGTVN